MSSSPVRAFAALNGQKRYNTGRPCKYGHVSDRQTSNGGCIECMRPTIVKPLSQIQAMVQRRVTIPDLCVPIAVSPELEDMFISYLLVCAETFLNAHGHLFPHARAKHFVMPGTELKPLSATVK